MPLQPECCAFSLQDKYAGNHHANWRELPNHLEAVGLRYCKDELNRMKFPNSRRSPLPTKSTSVAYETRVMGQPLLHRKNGPQANTRHQET